MAPNLEEATALSIAFSSFFIALNVFMLINYWTGSKQNPDDSLYFSIIFFGVIGFLGHANPYDAIIFAGCSTLGAYSGVWINLKLQLAKETVEKNDSNDKKEE